eukprot:1157532-Pelagomonas_calceolata.AAC.3
MHIQSAREACGSAFHLLTHFIDQGHTSAHTLAHSSVQVKGSSRGQTKQAFSSSLDAGIAMLPICYSTFKLAHRSKACKDHRDAGSVMILTSAKID